MRNRDRHTTACNTAYDGQVARLREYEANYPDYCRECGATGVVVYTENGAPHGAGYWPMQVEELCDACLGECPRCGHEFGEQEYLGFTEGQTPCPECEWNWGNNEGDCAPIVDLGCSCYQLEKFGKNAWLAPLRHGTNVICDRCMRSMEKHLVYRYTEKEVVEEEYYYCPRCKVSTERRMV